MQIVIKVLEIPVEFYRREIAFIQSHPRAQRGQHRSIFHIAFEALFC